MNSDDRPREWAAMTDGFLLKEILGLTPKEAAQALHRTRQALYVAFRSEAHFSTSELARLYLSACRREGRCVDRSAFLDFVGRTRGLPAARDVKNILAPKLGVFSAVALVLPDFQRLCSDEALARLARDAVFDLLEANAGKDVVIYLPSKQDKALMVSELGKQGIDIAHIRTKYGTRVAAIPPLAITDPASDAPNVFGISQGKFRRNEYVGGAHLVRQLDEWTKDETDKVAANSPLETA
jgi:hypothetical protein